MQISSIIEMTTSTMMVPIMRFSRLMLDLCEPLKNQDAA